MKLPLHKHIAHHTKRYAKHLTKYLYERDTMFATVAVFVFLILLGMIPINFYVLNPMKLALKDFDFNDIAYAKAHKDEGIAIDRRIVIVNIGHLDRAELGFLIEKVNEYNPKVIGLDTYFEGPKELEPQKDSILKEAFRKTKNLVAVSVADTFDHHIKIRENYFDDVLQKRGYANLVGEDVGTIRYYAPFEEVDGQKYPQITTAIVKEFNHAAYEKLEKRHKEVETINYTRSVNEEKKKYQVLDPDQLYNDGVDSNMLRDKIVLLGYYSEDPYDIEDKKFTPMNHKFYGKQHPDMFGIVVQANIISMVLDGNYIKKMPKWVAWVFAILIGWLHMSLYIRYYLESHIWFHLVAKLTQVFSVIFFAYLGMIIYDKFSVRLDMKYTLYVIALAVDVIYFYEAFATWMHRKFKYQTIFSHHHHGEEAHGHQHTTTHEHQHITTPEHHH